MAMHYISYTICDTSGVCYTTDYTEPSRRAAQRKADDLIDAPDGADIIRWRSRRGGENTENQEIRYEDGSRWVATSVRRAR